MSTESRFEAVVVTIPRVIIGVAIFVSIALNFANIVGRYIFQTPILWAEEILIFLMVWCVFMGAVLVTWDGRHIKMDLLSVMMPSPAREIVNFIGAVLFLGVCAFVIMQSWTVSSLMYRTEQRTIAAEVPMVLAHVAVLVSFCGMLLAVLIRFRSYVVNAFGSETQAVTKQVTETFGTFEGVESSAPPESRAKP
jgi:TRAP-type C4-dicarboxylate transport system permease small subunit